MLAHLRRTAQLIFAAVLTVVAFHSTVARADSIEISALDLSKMQQEWGKPAVDKSIEKHPITIAGKSFAHGLGTHAASALFISLKRAANRFAASVGVDDEVLKSDESKNYPIEFVVFGDDKLLFKSGPMKAGDAAKAIDVDLNGVKELRLLVNPVATAIAFCHGDWAEATIQYTGEKPVAIDSPSEPAEILTPQSPAIPKINGAKVVGVRPGHPLLFHVATTGDRPMNITADHLPEGLTFDSETGQLTGAVAKAGTYMVHLRASNSLGTTDRDLKIQVGDQIALTPPMGWNSWNCFATDVSDEKVRAAADAMVNSGLIDHGWTYINIDDCWEIRGNEPADHRRNADGSIRTNRKFPDMKALADYVHSKGLRVGLYSSPGTETCGGYTASYQFEEKDAQQYAAWGFDYLKYDWCSYGKVADAIKKSPNPPTSLEIFQHPYQVMHQALAKQNRDILFSLCQYGMGEVWNWGDQVGGNCWRTTDDINDSWHSMAGIGFSQNGHETGAGPGHWNDPDMLVVGKVGWGPQLHQTHLTPNEQYTHITLWSLLSAPLLIGCDMTRFDPFTLSLLTNDEVIAVNQDPLGKQAVRVANAGDGTEVWAKDLEDGSKAAGLFNRAETPMTVTVKWSDLGWSGSCTVRDLWRQKDLQNADDQFSTEVPRHGAVLIRISKK